MAQHSGHAKQADGATGTHPSVLQLPVYPSAQASSGTGAMVALVEAKEGQAVEAEQPEPTVQCWKFVDVQ
jgi:hypothetical protein